MTTYKELRAAAKKKKQELKKQQPAKPKKTPTPTEPTTTETMTAAPPPTVEKTIPAPAANTQPELEPMPGDTVSPFNTPRTEKAYTTEGLKPPSGKSSEPPPTMPGEEPAAGAPPPNPDAPPPPAPDSADPFVPGAGPLPGAEGAPAGGFTLPGGTPEQMIDWAFNGVNLLVRTYGKPVVSIKVHEEFRAYPQMVDTIEDANERNVEKIIFTKQEIELIKAPAVKVMNEAGVKGMTPKEELLAACAIVAAVKAKQISDIRKENKMLTQEIIQFIREENEKRDKKRTKTTTKDEGEKEE